MKFLFKFLNVVWRTAYKMEPYYARQLVGLVACGTAIDLTIYKTLAKIKTKQT